jgi:hypothetical protein
LATTGGGVLEFARAHAGYLVALATGATLAVYRASLKKLPDLLQFIVTRIYVFFHLYPKALGRYKRSLIATHSRISVGYMDFAIDVHKQYIKLKLKPGYVPAFRLIDPGSRTTTTIDEILRAAEDADTPRMSAPRLVILGQPGSGKTTLLKHLALRYSLDNARPTKRGLIPILVSLRDAREALARPSGKPFWNFLVRNLSTHQFPAADDFLRSKLQAGECLVLLDGLDELVKEDRRRIESEIKMLAIEFDKSPFIMTSRIEGYVRTSEVNFSEAEVAPLDPLGQEVTDFVSGILTPSDRPAQFLELLRSDPNLRRFAESPLLLSLVLFIYREGKGQLPRNRTKIYKNYFQQMLKDRDASRMILEYRNKFDSDDKELFLRKLAHSQFLKGIQDFPREELMSKVSRLSRHLHLEGAKESEFLDEIVQNGLLKRSHAEDKYSFTHPTFQEYYVAKEIKDANRIVELYDHLADPAWLEVLLFFCGLADFEVTEKLINDILDQRNDYVLAGRCLSHSPVGIAGASERIVPELIRQRSQASRATLLEIGDRCAIERLCDVLLLKPSPDNQAFAKECLRSMKDEAVTACVLDKANYHIKLNHLESALDCLEPFADFSPRIGEMINEITNKITNKWNSTLAKFREQLSHGSFPTAESTLKDYEKTEGTSARFNELLQLHHDLYDCWVVVSARIAEESKEEMKEEDAKKEEMKQLEKIRFAWGRFSSVCKQLSIDPKIFEEKAAGYCVQRLNAHGDVDTSQRWTERARCISYRAFRVINSARDRSA